MMAVRVLSSSQMNGFTSPSYTKVMPQSSTDVWSEEGAVEQKTGRRGVGRHRRPARLNF